MTKLPELGAEFNPGVQELVRLVTMNEYPQMFSAAEIESAKKQLLKNYGRLPTLAELMQKLGEEAIGTLAKEVLSVRETELQEIAERMGVGSPCHLCGGARNDSDPHYEFSLARNVQKSWGGVVAKLALNVVTMPFGVVVAPKGPGLKANLARCRLVLCSSCGEQRKGIFGAIKATQEECQSHPSWNRLVSAGFNKYFDRVETAKFS